MKLKDRLVALNSSKRIKIRAKKTKTGFSLYLDFSRNYERQRQFLKLYIEKPEAISPRDKENLYKAEIIRDKKEMELFEIENDFSLHNKASKSDILVYFATIAKKKSNLPTYHGCLKHLQSFVKNRLNFSILQFNMIDRKFCLRFSEYLLDKVSNNTARGYIKIFNAVLNKAIEEGYIKSNPCIGITIKYQDSKREFLTESEIESFAKVETEYKEIQSAFLFCCMTGLRFSDVKKLSFSDIQEDFLYFRQMKTKGVERMKLTEDAVTIISKQQQQHPNSEFVFQLGAYLSHINDKLRKIAEVAKIEKHISFHVSRHTFATWLITRDVDIYTVSKLLGHRDIATTQLYAKLIDSKKDSYINKLPKLL